MLKKIINFVMPITVGIWIGIGISNFPKLALYANFIVMIIVFLCALSLTWHFYKRENMKNETKGH